MHHGVPLWKGVLARDALQRTGSGQGLCRPVPLKVHRNKLPVVVGPVTRLGGGK